MALVQDYSDSHISTVLTASELVLLVLGQVLVLVLGLVLQAQQRCRRQTFVLSAESCDESVVWPQPVAAQAD